jgi:dephospho-CoA kinase
VKRILITGMSGTGKSTLILELAARDYKAVDADDCSEYGPGDALPGEQAGAPEWIWREDVIRELLSTEDADVLFLSGCASNQVRFYNQFDHIVLLSAPAPVLVERLATRTTNPYGKRPEEVAEVLHNQQTVEPLLRNVATLELDARAPVEELLESILDLVREDP